MEQKIRLLIKYFCMAMLGVFSAKFIDEFLPLNMVEDRIAELSFEKEGQAIYYTLRTDNHGSFDVPGAMFHNSVTGATVGIGYSSIFREIQSLHLRINEREIIAGNTNPPSISQCFTDLLVIALCSISLLVTYRFELKAVPFFFAIIAAAMRWWFIPFQW